MAGERILIVEDERAVARGLEYGLRGEGFEVQHAETGAQAFALVQSGNPALIVLDIRLPDISGFDVCRRLRAAGRKQPVLILTARDEEVDKVLGLEMGADDYLVKPYSLREVVARIRALLRRAYGELALPSGNGVARFGDIEVDLARVQVTRGGQRVELTATEFRLLAHLLAHPNQPLTRGALIEAVWGYESDIENDRTVDVHIRHLREKLEEDPSAPRWLVTVRGMGYRFEP